MSVGLTIKKLRLEKGLTQEELGELLGVKKAAVQKYESGQVQNLKQDTIKRLCEIFEKSPSLFVFGETEVMRFEVDLLEKIQMTYGNEVITLIEAFSNLDARGKEKVLEYVSDMEALQSLRAH